MTTYEEAIKNSIEYFNGDELAAQVFLGKYALTSPEGDILEKTPDDMHKRLAKEFARIEQKYPNPLSEDEILSYLKDFKYIIPQGSPMSGIGNPYQTVSISNCFVIEAPYDSYGGILKTDQEQIQIMKRRGGVGFDISTIRPKGLITKNAAKTTDGIAIFMERYSNSTIECAQSGRRGALMLSISIHHPEIETFINIKRDLKKVTGANISIRLSDEFMNAVKDNKNYEVRFPVDNKVNPQIRKEINAKLIWDQIIDSAWISAEPGLLFWDNIINTTPTECYKEQGFGTVSTNPCFSGETLIAVADGRNAVSIKQLSEEGKDVPVYSLNPSTGLVEIKTGRNPRITGHNQKIVRVTLDDMSFLDVTPNHEFLLKDGTRKQAKDLVSGDSLPRFTKEIASVKKDSKPYYRIHCNVLNHKNDLIYEHRMIAKFNNPEKWSAIYDSCKSTGWTKTGGLVVHHKDYNGLNNSPDNLEIMTFKEHQKFHAEHDCKGFANGNSYSITNEEIKNKAIELSKILGRRFSTKEWDEYASNNQLPRAFTEFRKPLAINPVELGKLCAVELGYEYVDADPRLVKTLKNMISQGYIAEIVENKVLVEKHCELCSSPFSINHLQREASFCSHACSLVYINSNKTITQKRNLSINERFNIEAQQRKQEQAKIYSKLKFVLKRKPLMKEWELCCAENNISYRLGKVMKYGFKSWKEIVQAGENYNHKVVSIEPIQGEHNVYNITVDDNHMVSIITSEIKNKNDVMWYSGIHVPQCGEIVLSPYDSCRLLLINTLSFVKNQFTSDAEFDYENFSKITKISQHLMDDMIDLELECIDKIINKVEIDPEPQEVKQVELDLWKKIKKAAINGRRTGLGVTAIGDTMAALNIQYGTEKSVEVIEEIYKQLGLNAYRETVNLAKERGAFPVYDYNLEKDHVFINRIMNLDENLRKNWEKYGRRNIALTTTAPAGSVSILTQTTSGIEPAFEVIYKRRKKINSNDKEARVDFIDATGIKWQEYKVYHHQYKKWMEITGKEAIEDSPYYKARANDIDWGMKIKAQAAAQKWICHSISNTTNLPSDISKETVSDIYMTGWLSGTKGVTIYRDGCRDGVLIAETKQKQITTEEFIETHAPKRPEILPCDIYQITVKGEKWNAFVGLYHDKPYEIFAGRSEHISIPKSAKKGFIKKNGTYNVIIGEGDNEIIVKDLAKVFANDTESAFTRTLSLALRHGTAVQFVVEQVVKGGEKDSDLFSFSKAISRVLKTYIKDGTKIKKKCDNCGSDELAYTEGCLTCSACSYSRCG